MSHRDVAQASVMPRSLSRFELIASLVPSGAWPVVDVGADHGRVAELVGAIATERAPHRRSAKPLPWVIADGLKPFGHVAVAIVTGMGARTISRILEEAPKPSVAVIVHAPDDPILLRQELAAKGWKIDAEGLAPEAGRFAEVIRAIPGQETARDATLAFGPCLLRGNDPHLEAHLRQLHTYWSGLATTTRGCAPKKASAFDQYVAFLNQVILDRFG